MLFQITPDECYCSFGNGIVYEFVTYDFDPLPFPCAKCSFLDCGADSFAFAKCLLLPCQSLVRTDKMDGFWQISQTVDYQHFVKILENRG